MSHETPERRLERVVEALSAELAGASDEDVREAADDLKLNLDMVGTIAFIGIRHLFLPHMPEKFGNPELELAARRNAQVGGRKVRRSAAPDKPLSVSNKFPPKE
jgi:hypothetical protein